MTLLPTFRTACELAQRLPALLSSFMELEAALGRNFREDSLTDLLIASFLQTTGLPVVVLTPNEARTGSDLDLEIVDVPTRTTIRYRIQAKRLSNPTAKWQTRSYKHLAHPNDTGLQVATLCDPANLAGPVPTIPLYAFYNHETVCTASGLPGIALADAFEIQHIINTSLHATPRPRFKQIGKLSHLFFKLEVLLCPGLPAAGRLVALPSESRDRYVRETQGQRKRRASSAMNVDVPNVGSMTGEQEMALRGARDGAGRVQRRASIERPRLIVSTTQ